MKLNEYVIASLMVWEDVYMRTELARFLCDNRADPIHGSFFARRRFGFHKPFEKRFLIHFH
jgi:hypothetical protein